MKTTKETLYTLTLNQEELDQIDHNGQVKSLLRTFYSQLFEYHN